MARPPLEVADLLRTAGDAFLERNRHWLRWKHIKVLLAIRRCRTAALGGHLDECTRCGYRATISYNSCRNRHCPKCQIAARERWIAARRRELLPTRYLHVVFTLPHRLAPLVLQNKKILYGLLFRTSAETLLEVARNPRHLGAEIGFFSVLHTWSQKLKIHPHVHCVVPAGGLSPDHTRWVRSRDNYFLPKGVLREVFRGKFVDALEQAFQNGQLNFQGDLKLLAQPKIFQVWRPNEGRRAADGCRNPTSISTTDQRCGMRLLSPTRKLCVLPGAPHLCGSPANRFFFSASSTTVSAILFAVANFRAHGVMVSCPAAQSRHGLTLLFPTIEFA